MADMQHFTIHQWSFHVPYDSNLFSGGIECAHITTCL